MDTFPVASVFRCRGCGLPFSSSGPDRVYIKRYAEFLLDHHRLHENPKFVETNHILFPDCKLPRDWQIGKIMSMLNGWFHCPLTCLPAFDGTDQEGIFSSTLCYSGERPKERLSVSTSPPPHAIGPLGFPDFMEDRLLKINALAGYPLQLPVHLPQTGCFRQERSEIVRDAIKLVTVLDRIEWEQIGDSPDPVRPWSDVPWTCDMYHTMDTPLKRQVPLSSKEAPKVFHMIRRLRANLSVLCSKFGYPVLSSAEDDETLSQFLETAFLVQNRQDTFNDRIECLTRESDRRKRERDEVQLEIKDHKKKFRKLRDDCEPPAPVTLPLADFLQLLLPENDEELPWMWSLQHTSALKAALGCTRCRRKYSKAEGAELIELADQCDEEFLFRLSPKLFLGSRPTIADKSYCNGCLDDAVRRKIDRQDRARVTLDRTKVLRRARKHFGPRATEYQDMVSELDRHIIGGSQKDNK